MLEGFGRGYIEASKQEDFNNGIQSKFLAKVNKKPENQITKEKCSFMK